MLETEKEIGAPYLRIGALFLILLMYLKCFNIYLETIKKLTNRTTELRIANLFYAQVKSVDNSAKFKVLKNVTELC